MSGISAGRDTRDLANRIGAPVTRAWLRSLKTACLTASQLDRLSFSRESATLKDDEEMRK